MAEGIRSLTGWWGVVLETRDAPRLAAFWSAVLGWPIASADARSATLNVPGTTQYLAVQHADVHTRPVWPPVQGAQTVQSHLDVEVTDLDAAVADALALGAVLAEHQPQPDVRVLLDPDGHPFCLYLATD